MATRRIHQFVRLCSMTVLAVSLAYMAQRKFIRKDLTSEGLSEITSGTKDLIKSVSTERPVVVTAYISKDVPEHFVPIRSRLLNILSEMEGEGAGSGLTVQVYEPEPHSEMAEEAEEKYGIAPRSLVSTEGGRIDSKPVFLGLAVSSGPREEVIPFFDRGLSVEYEVARALRVALQDKKRVVGILRNDAHIMGHFDLQARRQEPVWRIVDELKKQYEVRSVNPGSDISSDVDVLLVPQVSSLTQEALNKLEAYVMAGRAALIAADPLPRFNLKLAPSMDMLPPPGQGGGFGGNSFGGPPQEEKGDYLAFLRKIGVDWNDTRIAFDTENPLPRLRQAPPHIVVAGARDGQEIKDTDVTVDGLANIVVLWGGQLKPASDSGIDFKAILTTGKSAGFDSFEAMVDNSNFLFGPQMKPPRTKGQPLSEPVILGARLSGNVKSGSSDDNEASNTDGDEKKEDTKKSSKSINTIVLADLDMFHDQFFSIHEQGGDMDGDGLIDLRFDNVTFLLNAIDSLAGDDRFIELRKRQPKFRRLDRVDDYTKEAREKREKEVTEADAEAQAQLEEAQANLEKAIAEIREKPGLDVRTKQIMVRSAEEVENRKLQTKQQQIEREKAKRMRKIDMEHMRVVDAVQNRIRLVAVLLPPIPAILMGLILFARKRRREVSTIPASRKRGAA